MERVVISVSPEKIEDVKKAIEDVASTKTSIETAIVIFGPSNKVMELAIKAMSNGASSFSRG